MIYYTIEMVDFDSFLVWLVKSLQETAIFGSQ